MYVLWCAAHASVLWLVVQLRGAVNIGPWVMGTAHPSCDH